MGKNAFTIIVGRQRVNLGGSGPPSLLPVPGYRRNAFAWRKRRVIVGMRSLR